jgi:Ca2+-binding RTX toxin-like protein
MAKGELEYSDLQDFFERPYEVSARSDGSWLFTATSDRYVGWTVELQGGGLSGTGNFPDAGTIAHVIIKTPGGDVADDVDGLSLLATDLAAGFDFGDHQPGDDDGGTGDDDLAGDDGEDDLSGHGGDDDIAGDTGDDDLSGGGGDDSLSGDEGDDDLHGQGGDDELSGGSDDDHLAGGGGKDDLSGGDGNDLLKGQGKNDKLDGGADDDLLIGGGGKDTYIFALDFGSDTIKRFDHGKDKIDLKAIGITIDDVDIAHEHGDTIVTVHDGTGGVAGTITIDKVSGGKAVDAGDFLI